MANREWLYLFCYDVTGDKDRSRLASLLEKNLTRVQKSVFEGMLSQSEARNIGENAALLIGPDDSLRVYAITAAGHRNSFVFGAGYLPEREGYYLL